MEGNKKVYHAVRAIVKNQGRRKRALDGKTKVPANQLWSQYHNAEEVVMVDQGGHLWDNVKVSGESGWFKVNILDAYDIGIEVVEAYCETEPIDALFVSYDDTGIGPVAKIISRYRGLHLVAESAAPDPGDVCWDPTNVLGLHEFLRGEGDSDRKSQAMRAITSHRPRQLTKFDLWRARKIYKCDRFVSIDHMFAHKVVEIYHVSRLQDVIDM